MLEEIIKENEELIKKETLTLDLIIRESDKASTEYNINGEKLNIGVEVAK